MAFAQIYCPALGMRTSMKPSLAGIRPLPLLRRFSSPDPMEHRAKWFAVPAVRVSNVSNKKLFVSMCVNGSSSQSNFEADTATIYPEDKLDKTESIESSPFVELDNEKTGTEIHHQEEAVTPTQRSARIHDFCLGIPYGGFLFFGGLFGFVFSRNLTGLIFGSAISALSIFSLMVWSSGGSSIPFILGQTAMSVAFIWRHLQAYSLSKKLFPAVFYIALSAAMICFYAYVLISGGNPPPKKLAKARSWQ
ncbi:protein FATTY ACID EXPORT 1, chloroplastic-like [Curcuma longa]|uniref:protein FATTY ACID EXPORT 1, chloroplastic-like n=1 Tax=Curcuma longa TaxID=136217 RepID=UPI003D9F8A63